MSIFSRRPVYIGQPVPNYQQQIRSPEPGLGLTPPRRGETARSALIAPFALENQLYPQQHVYNFRDDPSGSGPGGAEVNTPPPAPMSILGRLWLALCPPPDETRLPQGDWLNIMEVSEMYQFREDTHMGVS